MLQFSICYHARTVFKYATLFEALTICAYVRCRVVIRCLVMANKP